VNRYNFALLCVGALLASCEGHLPFNFQGQCLTSAGALVTKAVQKNAKATPVSAPTTPVCPEDPICFEEIYTSNPKQTAGDPVTVSGIMFKPTIFLLRSSSPNGVSPQSVTNEARCLNSQGKWIYGPTPVNVLTQLGCAVQ
jgi:hypothetical protein